MTRVLVFGTFDGVHKGHEAFLAQATELGDELIVCAAQDEVILQLKGRRPERTLTERLEALQSLSVVTQAVGGDRELGVYQGVRQMKPNVIAFGYDQEALRKDFARFQQETGDVTPTVVLKPYRPDVYKSSKLRLS